jgi:hypothetical protein
VLGSRERAMSSWSNWQLVVPQRTTALYIPEDIYRCIFAYIVNANVDKSLISALARVCKFFAVIFMPVLLSSRSIDLGYGDFSIALLNNDPVACSQILHVKRCTLFYSKPIPFEHSAGLLLWIIRTLPNTLKSLSLKNVAITYDIFTALHSLTNLTSLAIDTANISSKFASLPSQSTVKLDLESFSLYDYAVDTSGDLQDTSIIPRSLTSFINFDMIRTLRINNTDIFEAITLFNQNKTLPQIKELRCTISDFGKLLLFLARVPNLASLSIDVDIYGVRETSFPSDASKLIPNLVTLRCPASLAQYLIPGRPVTDIEVYLARLRVYLYETIESSELIRLIRLSSAPIKVLHLSVNIYLDCACLFGDAFPELEELDMQVDTLTCNTLNVRLSYSFHCPYYKQSFLCAFLQFLAGVVSDIANATKFNEAQQQKQCTTINHLSLRFRNYNLLFDLPEQSRMAALLRVAFPALTSVDFFVQDNLGWTWYLSHHAERWIPSADGSSRKRMRAILEEQRRWFWKSEIDVEAAFLRGENINIMIL